MTVKVRPYRGRKDQWECDIRFTWPDGSEHRVRKKAPVSSKSAAMRWGLARERDLLLAGKPRPEHEEETKEIPTLEAFAPRFIEEHCIAERLKPSTVQSHKDILRRHLLPLFGKRRLDTITNADVQRIKARMAGRHPKTVNNVLSALNVILKRAEDWGAIEQHPCKIRLLKVSHDERSFYVFEDYEQLIKSAERIDSTHLVLLLLGGDAGLRRGEINALQWDRVRFHRRTLVVAASMWKGEVTKPKSGRHREIPMTERLFRALKAHRHLQSDFVLTLPVGRPVNRDWMMRAIRRIETRAGMPVTGKLHVLRHTFCSHLAMKGAPAKAIQELAGHADLSTTMRYMHLSPGAREEAIRLLDRRADGPVGVGSGVVPAARG